MRAVLLAYRPAMTEALCGTGKGFGSANATVEVAMDAIATLMKCILKVKGIADGV